MNPRHVWADFRVFSTGYFRNAAAIFFSLFFPIILIGIFGLIYSGGTQKVQLYAVNLDDHSPTSVAFLKALNDTGAVDVIVKAPGEVDGNLGSWLANNSNPVGLVIPAGFGQAYQNRTPVALRFYENPADPASSGIAGAAIGGVSNQFNLRLTNGTNVVTVAETNLGSPLYKAVDYLVPGLIGFAVLTSPMFSMVEIASSYKKDNLFRQLSLTPLTKSEWLLAKILWFVVLSMISAAIMIAFGYLVFHGHFLLTWEILPFLVLGPFFFVSLGMLCGSVTKTPETAAIVGNVVTFPMMFLSGTFFPVSMFPPGLQSFAHLLPLFYIIDGMNQVMLFGSVGHALFDAVLILVGAVLVFAAAVSVFKWRES